MFTLRGVNHPATDALLNASGRVALLRVSLVLVGSLLEARLVLGALGDRVVRDAIDTGAANIRSLNVGLEHVRVGANIAVTGRGTSQSASAHFDIANVRSTAIARYSARVASVEVGRNGRLVGQREVRLALLNDRSLVLAR
jgi:hypothetical protein